MDLSTEFLLGESIGAQQGAPEASQFLQTFDEVLLGWNNRRQSGIMAARYMFDRKWPAAVQRLYSYLDKYVKRALAEMKEVDLDSKVPEDSTAGRYILLPQLAKHVRDPVTLRFEVLNVFIPSRDTTSALFGNIFWALSRHPKIWAELRQCARTVNFQDSTFQSATNLATSAALLPFRHVIYETLRTIGPSGRQFRIAKRDTVLPRGGGIKGTSPAFVPRGTVVCTVAHCVHHDKDNWGPDADEFRPSRWLADEAEARAPWTFLSFVGGPHACPAQQQVIIQATYILVRMVQAFESIECRDEVREYVERQHMVIESRRGVEIALKGKE